MAAPSLPAAGGAGSAAPHPDAYHPDPATIVHDGTRCMARRLLKEDRRWAPKIYTTGQCANAPVSGGDLCATCRRHETKGTAAYDWNGRITGPIPDDSHTTNNLWFVLKEPRWLGDDGAKPKTARQAAALKHAPMVPDVALEKWVHGKQELEIADLSAAGQIKAAKLDELYTLICGEAPPKKFLNKLKPAKCEELISLRNAALRAVPEIVTAPAPAPAPVVATPDRDQMIRLAAEAVARATDALAAANAALVAVLAVAV